MSKKAIMSFTKKAAVGFAALVVIATGIILLPKVAKAEEIKVGEIVYDNSYKMTEYWNASGDKTAPVKNGYVFGGWYEKTGDQIFEAVTVSSETAYAKFVPDYVLSVRAQNEDGTSQEDGIKNSVRVISSVDTVDYQNVGFDIWLANKTQLKKEGGALITEKVFDAILVENEKVYAKDVFGSTSQYFSVWRLDNIQDSNDSKIIYVRPYWITMDGTKVEGLAKYVHVEDEYLGYISVPINLSTGEEIAGGIVNLSYTSSSNSKAWQFIGFETGRLLTEMSENHATTGVVKIAGNASAVNELVNADGIYANIRLKNTDNLDASDLTFEATYTNFSNWKQELVKTIWPIIQY